MRQSFSERICDDLCEEIVHCLSIEDKFRLQCVSKQFQRSIINTTTELTIDFNDMTRVWENELETILKQFPNISKFQFKNYNDHGDPELIAFNRCLAQILKYCNHVTRFEIEPYDHAPRVYQVGFEKLLDKFGSDLVSVAYCTYPDINPYVLLETLNIKKLMVPAPLIADYAQFNKLESIRITELMDRHMDELQAFTFRHWKTVTHLSLAVEVIRYWQQPIREPYTYDVCVYPPV